MVMLCTCENSQALQLPLCDSILLKHAAYCKTHCQLGLLLHERLILGFLQSAGVTGMSAVILLLQFFTSEHSILRRSAANAAVLPMGFPAASRMYHLRSTVSLVTIVVFWLDIFLPPYSNYVLTIPAHKIKIEHSPFCAPHFYTTRESISQ